MFEPPEPFLSFRKIMLFIAVGCACIFGYALYLQHIVGLIPCPMCIVQRYAFTAVALFCVLAALNRGRRGRYLFTLFALVLAGFGAFTAARQSWLQWYPPEIMTCGRDFYGMIEAFPLSRYVPMIFKGSGDCVKIDWTFLGLSIANLSFIAFVGMMLLMLFALRQTRR